MPRASSIVSQKMEQMVSGLKSVLPWQSQWVNPCLLQLRAWIDCMPCWLPLNTDVLLVVDHLQTLVAVIVLHTCMFIALKKSREVLGFFHTYKLRSQTTPRPCSIFCFTSLSKAPGKRQPVKCFCWDMICSLDQSVRLSYFSSSLLLVFMAVVCRVSQPFYF